MPRPGFPPTPASSTDLTGKDKPHRPSLEMSFTLPPPAMVGNISGSDRSTASPVKSSDSSYHPASPPLDSPASTSRNRRRLSNAAQGKDDFTLPPPPTRSRKIIHMKPKGQDEVKEDTKERKQAKTSANSTGSSSKRKQPSSTSVAGRKIARKTAHSLIERRRRSKMNEEFGILKDMIPACSGQEMHKLAILQASIDYLRYLEQCVTDLKAANGPAQSSVPQPRDAISPKSQSPGTVYPSPFIAPPPRRLSQNPSASPIFSPSITSPYPSGRIGSISLPSPVVDAVGRQHIPLAFSGSITTSRSTSTTTSPALLPMNSHHQERGDYNENRMDVDMDHEATAALLMLNADRRGSRTQDPVAGGSSNRSVGKGMSVKDLLST